jgi:hypothetical protein
VPEFATEFAPEFAAENVAESMASVSNFVSTLASKLRSFFSCVMRCLSLSAQGLGVLCLSVAMVGCAYRSGQADRQLPGGYRAVAVPMFKNLTHEAGVEVYFTNAFIRELERARVGRVSAKSESQATIEGSIDSISYSTSNQVKSDGDAGKFLPADSILNTEYRILLTATLRLRRNSDQKVLWEGGFSGERSYLAPKIGAEGLNSANALYNHSARYQNIQLMAADLMVEAHDRLTENF